MSNRIGRGVKIVTGKVGMPEFEGKTGRIIDAEYGWGCPTMYRVRLDTPVEIKGLGMVQDDLWEGRFLKTIRG